jgi:hypothetical protein
VLQNDIVRINCRCNSSDCTHITHIFQVDCTGNVLFCKACAMGYNSHRVMKWMETKGNDDDDDDDIDDDDDNNIDDDDVVDDDDDVVDADENSDKYDCCSDIYHDYANLLFDYLFYCRCSYGNDAQ